MITYHELKNEWKLTSSNIVVAGFVTICWTLNKNTFLLHAVELVIKGIFVDTLISWRTVMLLVIVIAYIFSSIIKLKGFCVSFSKLTRKLLLREIMSEKVFNNLIKQETLFLLYEHHKVLFDVQVLFDILYNDR